MSKSNYDWFHNQTKIQKKVIPENNFTYRIAIEKILSEIGNRKSLDILDYGSGVGTIDFYLGSLGHYVIGMELSPNAVKISQKSANAIGVSDRAKFVSIHSKLIQKFDLVLCLEVIEHIPNEMTLLKKLNSVLKRKGILVLSSPSSNAPLVNLGLNKEFDTRVGHLRRYSESQLRKILEKNGFEIKSVSNTEGIIRNSMFVFPTLEKFVKFFKGPFSDLVTFADNLTIPVFGASNIYVVATKK